MSHVFISYAHEDGDSYRKAIINLLEENGFQADDYWYDKRNITLGEEWRSEIDTALDESFLVIIVLTKGAIKSHAVTYEWSRAIGDGIKVIPVLFEDLKDLLKKSKHPLVERKQWLDWSIEGVQEKVMMTIHEHRKFPPDTIYLNRLIIRKTLSFRILVRVWTWLYPYANENIEIKSIVDNPLPEWIREEWNILWEYLPELIVDKSHAFISKQVRDTRNLIQVINQFWKITHRSNNSRYPVTIDLINSVEKWREQFEQLIAKFEATDPDNYDSSSYKELDIYLQKMSEGWIPPSGSSFIPPTGSLPRFIIQQVLDNDEKSDKIIEALAEIILSKQNGIN